MSLSTPGEEQEDAVLHLDDLPGLDYEEGLARVGGSQDLYLDILNEYCEYYQDVTSEFTSLLDQGDYAAARKKAHSLKGAAGNISAVDLKLAAEALETACLEGDLNQARVRLEDVNQALQQLFANAKQLKNIVG